MPGSKYSCAHCPEYWGPCPNECTYNWCKEKRKEVLERDMKHSPSNTIRFVQQLYDKTGIYMSRAMLDNYIKEVRSYL